MADARTKEQRRWIMQGVRGRNTGPEWTVRRLLHGCFWHAHGCRYGRPPKSRLDYWLPKLERNEQRDAEVRTHLEALRWQVLPLWGCELKDLDAAAAGGS